MPIDISAPGGSLVPLQAALNNLEPATIDVTGTPYNVVTGSGQSSGTRTANGTALNAAATAAAALPGGGTLLLPAAVIEYTATAVDSVGTPVNTGFQLPAGVSIQGAGIGISRLVQFATNYPAITTGPMNAALSLGCKYRDFSVGFGTSQVGQAHGIGVQIGNTMLCTWERINVDPFVAGGARVEAYVGWWAPNINSIFSFECWFNELIIGTGAFSFLRMECNTSGSSWGVIYIGGTSNQFVDYRTPSDYPVYLETQASFGTVLEMNIEWIQLSASIASLLFIDNTRAISFGQLRFEGCKLAGFNPSLINASLCNLTINRLDLYNVTIATGDMTGTYASVFQGYTDSHIFVGGGFWQWNSYAAGTGVLTAQLRLWTQAGVSGQMRARVEVNNIYMQGNNANTFNFDANLLNSVTGNIIEFGCYKYNPLISSVESPKIQLLSGTTYELYGWAIRPEIVVSFALAAALTITWHDFWGSGAPGSQLPATSPDILMLTRDASSTGAFNVLLKNNGGTTITTQTTASTTNHITRNGTTLTNN